MKVLRVSLENLDVLTTFEDFVIDIVANGLIHFFILCTFIFINWDCEMETWDISS